jgi:hypothetical protein
MSGGSLDYAYYKVEDIAREISVKATTPLQKAFAKHLFLVSKALHDLEWVYSSDRSPGSEIESIQKVFGEEWKKAELNVLKEEAKELIEQIKKLL